MPRQSQPDEGGRHSLADDARRPAAGIDQAVKQAATGLIIPNGAVIPRPEG